MLGCRTSTTVADFMWVVCLLIVAKSFSAVSRITLGQICWEFYLLLKSAGKGLDPLKKKIWIFLSVVNPFTVNRDSGVKYVKPLPFYVFPLSDPFPHFREKTYFC